MESSIRQVSYADILHADGAGDLLSAYAEECSIPEIGIPHPQPESYAKMEEAGTMHCFGAYYNDKLVGFASVLNAVLPHYGKRVSNVESIYVTPEHRREFGRALMAAIESHAEEIGCVAILYSAPVHGEFGRFLLMNDKYRRTSSVFVRRLG